MASRLAVALSLSGLWACALEARSSPSFKCAAASLVYGDDDRREAWEAKPLWRELAMHFVVAIADKSTIERLAAGQVSLDDLQARHTVQVCADERYADQPSLAVCSGVLLAPDLLLTAAHCVDREKDCESLVYLAQFTNDREGAWSGPQPGLIRGCKSIARIDASHDRSGTALDVALVQLDAALDVPMTWFPIRADAPRLNEQVVAIGHPSGLPLKLDHGGKVISYPHETDGYVTADIDAFRGSSGGPVFDAEGALLGVVLGGGPDHDYDRGADCLRARTVNRANKELAERVAPVAEALNMLCHSGSEPACELYQTAEAIAPEDRLGFTGSLGRLCESN